MFRRRIPFTQMALATVLGVAGGVYIYKPFFEPRQKIKDLEEPSQDMHKNLNLTEDKSSNDFQVKTQDSGNVTGESRQSASEVKAKTGT